MSTLALAPSAALAAEVFMRTVCRVPRELYSSAVGKAALRNARIKM